MIVKIALHIIILIFIKTMWSLNNFRASTVQLILHYYRERESSIPFEWEYIVALSNIGLELLFYGPTADWTLVEHL